MNNKTVLRVGVYNNFNFTAAELAAVNNIPDNYFPFVNSNSLVTIDGTFPSIITINPYLDSWQPPVGDLHNIKACRVKWVEGALEHVYKAQTDAIDWCLNHNIPVLLTYMRFSSKATMSQYVPTSSHHLYAFSKGWYRINTQTKTEILARLSEYAKTKVATTELIYTCDLLGEGCPTCGNCARLTYGDPELPVEALSLSCSGDGGNCIFHCPDCWAKRLGRVATFKWDAITKNKKQVGNKK